ncbi:uncharacterized protein LOC105427540 [Pogonomyrmex barbatus]|uniref:Uncharacterized protein LOC105427540 n=1 Tax=Pogonomyrmex barbatus TaxID=144034 RepID=A0A6I9WAE2_9HYME|nr:uncharacterized protein LOC105427540 [Pogonomyrmex barbatus]
MATTATMLTVDLKPKTISKNDSTRTKITERRRSKASVRLLFSSVVVRSSRFSLSRHHLFGTDSIDSRAKAIYLVSSYRSVISQIQFRDNRIYRYISGSSFVLGNR